MSLLDEVVEESVGVGPGGTCTIKILSRSWTPEFLAEFNAALESTAFSTVISAVLLKRGIDIPAQTVQRHRKGRCRCGIAR